MNTNNKIQKNNFIATIEHNGVDSSHFSNVPQDDEGQYLDSFMKEFDQNYLDTKISSAKYTIEGKSIKKIT
ncbi:MAG TPA: hypothetical protein PJ997_01085 [Candidatus Paceibacterota bacterium]|nr:hypothetical protein [Candidatus Paceibacterota bacterium]HMP18917.1 hypothetical protein [Candidatus Paceibacterota bacterium]HMP85078.1 hypothetical protein [Candidatus Paceibacterota bacterium]